MSIVFLILINLATSNYASSKQARVVRGTGSCQDGSCESFSFDKYLWPLWLIPCIVLIVPCVVGGVVIACRELAKKSGMIQKRRPNLPIARMCQSFDNPDLQRTLRHYPRDYTTHQDGEWNAKQYTAVNTSSYPYLSDEVPPPNYSQLLSGHKTE